MARGPLEPWTFSTVRCMTQSLQRRWRLRLQRRPVASLAGQMARPAAPVGTEGAHRAGSGGAALTPPVQTAYCCINFATAEQAHL